MQREAFRAGRNFSSRAFAANISLQQRSSYLFRQCLKKKHCTRICVDIPERNERAGRESPRSRSGYSYIPWEFSPWKSRWKVSALLNPPYICHASGVLTAGRVKKPGGDSLRNTVFRGVISHKRRRIKARRGVDRKRISRNIVRRKKSRLRAARILVSPRDPTLFSSPPLTVRGRRRGETPFVASGAYTSRNKAEQSNASEFDEWDGDKSILVDDVLVERAHGKKISRGG